MLGSGTGVLAEWSAAESETPIIRMLHCLQAVSSVISSVSLTGIDFLVANMMKILDVMLDQCLDFNKYVVTVVQ